MDFWAWAIALTLVAAVILIAAKPKALASLTAVPVALVAAAPAVLTAVLVAVFVLTPIILVLGFILVPIIGLVVVITVAALLATPFFAIFDALVGRGRRAS